MTHLHTLSHDKRCMVQTGSMVRFKQGEQHCGNNAVLEFKPGLYFLFIANNEKWLIRHRNGLFLKFNFSLISNLNLIGLFSTDRGKRDLENQIID